MLLGTLLLAFLAACNSDTKETPAVDLTNTRWALVSFEQLTGSVEETPTLPETVLTLEFQPANQVGGRGGCNQFGAQVQIVEDKISFQKMVATEMACEEGVMIQEQRYYDALAAAETFSVSDGRLRIWYEGGQAVLNFVPQTDGEASASLRQAMQTKP